MGIIMLAMAVALLFATAIVGIVIYILGYSLMSVFSV